MAISEAASIPRGRLFDKRRGGCRRAGRGVRPCHDSGVGIVPVAGPISIGSKQGGNRVGVGWE